MAYGFNINNNAGTTILDSNDTTFRIIHRQFCVWDYNSSFTVSNFDSNFGEYYIQPHLTAANTPTTYGQTPAIRTTGTNYTYDFAGTFNNTNQMYNAGYYLSFMQDNKPSLSWNNTSKTMTVVKPSKTPFQFTLLQSGPFWDNGGHYSIIFFEIA